jgi:hypothetical protein
MIVRFFGCFSVTGMGPRQLSRYSDSLRAGRSEGVESRWRRDYGELDLLSAPLGVG